MSILEKAIRELDETLGNLSHHKPISGDEMITEIESLEKSFLLGHMTLAEADREQKILTARYLHIPLREITDVHKDYAIVKARGK